MKILFCRPTQESAGDGTRCLATVDVEVNPDVRLYALRLLQMADGEHRLYAPQAGRRRVASFSAAAAKQLTEAALAAYRRVAA